MLSGGCCLGLCGEEVGVRGATESLHGDMSTRRKKLGQAPGASSTASKENVLAGARASSRAATRVNAAHDKGINGGARAGRRPASVEGSRGAVRALPAKARVAGEGKGAHRKLRLG